MLHPNTQQGLQLLKSTQVGNLFPDHPSNNIIFFSKSDSLSTVFKGLIDARILSAPVYDPIRRIFNAFVDMVDIVSYIVGVFSEKELADALDAQEAMQERCGKASGISGRDPFMPVESMAPLQAAIMKMVKWKVHRIPVIDSEGELITVITQSHVVKFLYQHMYMFGTLPQATVEELSLPHSPVVTISLDQKVMDAFKTMQEQRVSAVAVVDAAGKLVGNISVSDLKLIGYDGSMLSRLYYPVSQFLHLLSKDNMIEAPVTVGAGSLFREVVSKLVNTRIHRVYTTDESGAPTGVITQHEVLAALLKYLNIIV
jgi:CBS domain-containing protein